MMRKLIAVLVTLLVAGLPAGAAHATTGGLAWGPCPGGGGPDGMECARLTVPVDWSRPAGRTLTLMVGRLAARQPSEGTVLVNYGGPGAPGVEFTRDRVFTGQQPFAALREHLDVVTWDPRGYPGGSTALDFSCLASLSGRGLPDRPGDAAAFATLADQNAATAAACRKQDPELFDHMDTDSNVHDMEAIRRALGVSTMDLYMGSYGSVYGETYASRYPHRVRGMVIDGGGDHTVPFDRAQDAIAHDNTVRMDRFVSWCTANTSCALHGRDARRAWRTLVAAADRTPVPASGTDVPAPFDGWTMREVAAGWLIRAGADNWGRFASAVVTAESGDAAGFVNTPTHPYPSTSYPVSECHEWPHPTSYRQLTAALRRLDTIDPDLGAAGTMEPAVMGCIGWPGTLTDPPRPLPAHLPPLLGVGTWSDFPATDRVVSRVPASSTIYHDGTGHELYATGNTCVIAHVDAYFRTGTLPAQRTPC